MNIGFKNTVIMATLFLIGVVFGLSIATAVVWFCFSLLSDAFPDTISCLTLEQSLAVAIVLLIVKGFFCKDKD